MGFFSKKKHTVTQEPMMEKEQLAAMRDLVNFYKTGKFGGYQAGAEYGGKLGEFEMTDLEKTGQGKLSSMVAGGLPELFRMGGNEIKKLLTTEEYDPYSEKGVYKGFKKNVLRESAESSDILNRDLAVTGDLYSTAHAKEQGLLRERTHGTLTNKLAELYDTFAGRKLEGARTAADMGVAGERMEKERIGMTQSVGALGRLLKDAEAKTKYADWQRQRSEWLDLSNVATNIFNRNIPYGVKEMTSESASPFSKLMNTGLQIAGAVIGGGMGGPIGAILGSQIGKGAGSIFS